jgi:type I restriction enzyme S subunit
MKLSTAEIYRQKESSSLVQTAKFIFSKLLANCEVFELGVLLKGIKTGKTPSKNEKKYYDDEFIDWFKPNEIGNRKYLEKAENKLSKFAYDSGQVTVYKKNSILINAIGDVGRIAILNHEASSNQQITGIELNEDKILIEYCYYYLLANRYHFYKDLFQTTLPIVNQKKIRKIPVPVPELNEQKRIVAFLNKLEKINSIEELKKIKGFDDFIEIANKFYVLKKKNSEISTELTHQLDLVKQLRQAFLREAMQGKLVEQNQADEPATELLAKIKAEKEQLIKEKKIKKHKALPPISEDEIPFEIPESWVWCRLGEIVLDQVYGTSSKADLSGDIPVLRMGNISTGGKILYSNLKYVSKSIKDLPKLYLKNDDLVFNRTNSYELVGKCGVFNNVEPYTLASYLIRVRFGKNTSSQFISNYINSSLCRETQIEPQIIQQNGQANFNGTKLASIIIPLPPLSEQKRIVAKLDELMAYCDSLEESIKNSQAQNEMLLGQVLREALEPEEKRERYEKLDMVAEDKVGYKKGGDI